LFPPLEMATEHFDENYLLVQGVNYWLSTCPFVSRDDGTIRDSDDGSPGVA
jgi:hypothetical protein